MKKEKAKGKEEEGSTDHNEPDYIEEPLADDIRFRPGLEKLGGGNGGGREINGGTWWTRKDTQGEDQCKKKYLPGESGDHGGQGRKRGRTASPTSRSGVARKEL